MGSVGAADDSRKSARADDRKIMNAIFYVLRTGMPWRDLPERYGPYTTAYTKSRRWRPFELGHCAGVLTRNHYLFQLVAPCAVRSSRDAR